jgi:hypothetical protein
VQIAVDAAQDYKKQRDALAKQLDVIEAQEPAGYLVIGNGILVV